MRTNQADGRFAQHTGQRRSLQRLCWVALLVLHTLALPSLLTTAASASITEQLPLIPRIAGLLLSAVYFGLKFFEVPWLRVAYDRRTVTAAILIVVLLHVGVLDRAMSAESAFSFEPRPWLFVGAVLSTGLLIRRLLTELAIRFPGQVVFSYPPPICTGADGRAWRPHYLFAHLRFAAPRAPPAA